MQKQLLHQGWTVQAVGDLSEVPQAIRGRQIPATVPGCVHTDLLSAGLIEEPYWAQNEKKLQWIGRCDWQYRRTFRAERAVLDQPVLELVAEGVDTVATFDLNGQVIGQTQDMHFPYRFDARAAVREGENTLVVTFRSAERYAAEMEAKFGYRPHTEKYACNCIRKMACNFGWDWGPTFITCGLWKPIYLAGWSAARIEYVRPLVLSATPQRATVEVHVDLAHAPATAASPLNAVVTLTGPAGEKLARTVAVAPGQKEAVCTIDVDKPQLWWPVNFGGQSLYGLSVELQSAGGAALDQWSGRIGLRTVRLNTDPDETGAKFIIEVNGRPVFCKGANWIPDDCFLNRVDRDRYRRRLTQALDSNMNMLRVWGGGIFETDDFYELCDEMGIMVWQDFLFACAMYPEEEPFRSLVEQEARANVARLSGHPSLVFWNGCNENIWAWFDWGTQDGRQWKEVVKGRTWGLGYYLDLLPRVVKELDPSRPYWPASPYSGSMDVHPLDDRFGNKHVWDAWNQKDYLVYRQHKPRFVSEFGHQAPPTWPMLQASIPADEFRKDSPSMMHHQKSAGANGKLDNRLAEHFDMPESFDDWLFLTWLNQARAITVGVEHFRALQPICYGSLYWQINDCWPVNSWSCVDGSERPKLLWYATRRFYAPRLLTIQPRDGGLALIANNDTDEPWAINARVRRLNWASKELAGQTFSKTVPPRGCEIVAILPANLATPADATGEVLVAQAGTERALWYFEIDKNLAYPRPDFAAEVVHEPGLTKLTITARSFIRDLAIFPDRLDANATIDDQMVTLLPSERVTFTIRAARPLSAAELTSPPVLQCANRFGKKSG